MVKKYIKSLMLVLLALLSSTTQPQPQEAPQFANAPFGNEQGMGVGNEFPGGEGMPPMTEEDLIKWQQEVDAQINQYVSTLTPNEQAQFHKDVAEMTELMNNMSEEELSAYVNEMLSQGMQEAQPTAPAAEEPTPEAPIVQEEPKASVADVTSAANTQKVLKLLNNLITRTERLLRKTLRMPELSGKIQKWVSKDKIKEWQAALTWETMRKDLDTFVQRLHILKDSRDPKTKNYRYFDELIKDEALFNKLNKISTSLTTEEPKIESPDQLGQPLTSSTKNALKEILGSFAEALYTLDLITEIDKLIAHYEPRAKTLREEEEASTKRAFEESKKPRQEALRKEVGSGRNKYAMPETGGTLADYYGGGNYYAPSGYDSGYYGNNYDTHSSDYAAEPATRTTPTEPTAGNVPSVGGKTDSGKPVGGKESGVKKGGNLAADDETGDSAQPAPKAAPAAMDDRKANRQLDTIENNLESASELAENEVFKKLEQNILRSPVNVGLVNQLNEMIAYVKKATREIKEINSSFKTMSAATKEAYSKELKSIIKKYSKPFDEIAKQLPSIIKQKGSLPASKKYAYFSVDEHKDAAVTETPALANKKAANLELLATELESFYKLTYEYTVLM